MIRKKPPTMGDVAAKAGVSRVTASVVLNNIQSNTRVSAETRTRIHAAAALHYRPNLAACALRNQTTNRLGFYNTGGWVDLRNPFFSHLMNGIYRGCYATRKSLLLHTPPLGADGATIYAELASGLVDGLLILAVPHDPLLPFLRESHLSNVAVADALDGIPSVVADDVAGATAIFSHLYERGHRRLFYQISELPHTSIMRRYATISRLAEQAGVPMETVLVPDGGSIGLSPVLRNRLAEPAGRRPTAVVCWNDRDAIGVATDALQQGLRIPDDLAIVGYSDETVPRLPDGRRLTTVRVQWEPLAEAAARLLVAAIAGQELPPETIHPVTFVAGDTT